MGIEGEGMKTRTREKERIEIEFEGSYRRKSCSHCSLEERALVSIAICICKKVSKSGGNGDLDPTWPVTNGGTSGANVPPNPNIGYPLPWSPLNDSSVHST